MSDAVTQAKNLVAEFQKRHPGKRIHINPDGTTSLVDAEPPRTVRVRIAVAVNDKGEWDAGGWNYLVDEKTADARMAKGVLEDLIKCHEDGEVVATAVHFIEADIPLPASQTIEGEVKA